MLPCTQTAAAARGGTPTRGIAALLARASDETSPNTAFTKPARPEPVVPRSDRGGRPDRRCALYLRVSGGEGQTTANQLPELEQLAGVRGFEIAQLYEEIASAAKRRPAFKAMMADARAGRFDVLLIWALDRFGRSMFGNLEAVLELDRIGVRVISVRESWLDTDGPVRSLLVAIFSWVAEQERARLIERTIAGLARARREGRTLGRPRVAVDLDEALALRRRGVALTRSAERLGVGRSTLARALAAYRRGFGPTNPRADDGRADRDPESLEPAIEP